MASHRPKLPPEILLNTSAMILLPDIGQEITLNGSFLISSATGPDPKQPVEIPKVIFLKAVIDMGYRIKQD